MAGAALTPAEAVRLARERLAHGSAGDAEALLRAALAMDTRNVPAIEELARLREAAGRAAEAAALAREARRAGGGEPAVNDVPGAADAALGRQYVHEGHSVEAVALLAAALDRAPTDVELRRALCDHLCVRAAAYADAGRTEEAVANWRRVRALEPSRFDAVWNECVMRLRRGDYAEGFRLYEQRLSQPGLAADGASIGRPRWTGEEPVTGRRVFVHAEQGIGDTLMFARYLPRVATQAAAVVASVQPPLQALLSRCLPQVEVHPQQAVMVLPAFDLHCALPSLPHALRTTFDTVPAELPYLHADPERVARWDARLGGPGVPRVGIAWAGNPAYSLDAERSIPAAALPRLAVPGVRWFALQRSLRPGDAEAMRALGMEHPADALEDFEEYAALVANLDLVLSVDTAAAHLAGALGRPLWALLAGSADWRWTRGVARNPWYPQARLFWQAVPGDWAPLLDEVRRALVERTAGSAASQSVLDPAQASRLGAALVEQGRLEDARAVLRAVLRTSPRDPEANALLLRLPMDHPGADALLERADALASARRHEEALECLQRALEAGAPESGVERRRGASYAALGHVEACFASLARAQALDPGDVEAHWLECGLRLRLGDFAEGFRKYEWRLRRPGRALHAGVGDLPRWTGAEPLEGRGLFLHAEQGYGDSIQFLRYVEPLRARGALVMIAVPAPLVALARASFPWAGVYEQAEKLVLPAFDLHCPLPSLPLAFGTTLETVPRRVPYLELPPGRVPDPRIASARPRLRVGLAWSGNPAHAGDRERSIGAAAMLAALPEGPAYFGLQPGLPEADRRALEARGGVDLGPGLADFADTAAAVRELDLVVAVDTSVAHLAGALGREAWILLPRVADWRWLLEREDSPWYPHARLLRQRDAAGWPPVLARLRAELLARAAINPI